MDAESQRYQFFERLWRVEREMWRQRTTTLLTAQPLPLDNQRTSGWNHQTPHVSPRMPEQLPLAAGPDRRRVQYLRKKPPWMILSKEYLNARVHQFWATNNLKLGRESWRKRCRLRTEIKIWYSTLIRRNISSKEKHCSSYRCIRVSIIPSNSNATCSKKNLQNFGHVSNLCRVGINLCPKLFRARGFFTDLLGEVTPPAPNIFELQQILIPFPINFCP